MKLVFPVRFAEGERVVQTTADEVSESGTYVISTTPPAVGAGVTLSLYLPDAADPVNASGVVRTAERGEERPGFEVEFSAIADDGPVRIRKVLQLAQSTGAPNLRAFLRRAGGAFAPTKAPASRVPARPVPEAGGPPRTARLRTRSCRCAPRRGSALRSTPEGRSANGSSGSAASTSGRSRAVPLRSSGFALSPCRPQSARPAHPSAVPL